MANYSSVLITGATGFIGSSIFNHLYIGRVYDPIAAIRNLQKASLVLPQKATKIQIADIDKRTDWTNALADVSAVIHTAARVHILNEHSTDSLSSYQRINVEGTLHLAREASRLGVKRFIYLSSIGVNGAQTFSQPFNEQSISSPYSPYSLTKWEAEKELMRLANEGSIEIVIIRPPLVYGAAAPGNFYRLLRTIEKSIPLPLGAVNNRRSLVYIENLVDLIITCIDHPAAANQTFLVSDDEDLSTTDLLRRMAAALGKPARLLPVPAGLLYAGATLLRKRDIARRLLESLQVDISHTKEVLGWKPPVSIDEALKKTAEDFLAHETNHA